MNFEMRPRAGTIADTDEVVRLRQLMFVEMGSSHDDAWVPRAVKAYRSGLGDGSLIAVVIDVPEGGGLVAAGVITFSPVLPGPNLAGSVKAQVSSMSTDRRWRRRGLARLVLAALLERVDARGDVAWTELLATEDGIGLYTSFGFDPHDHPTLRRHAPAPRPPEAQEDPTLELPVLPRQVSTPLAKHGATPGASEADPEITRRHL